MDFVSGQSMRLTMDAFGRFFIWRFDQAKDRAGAFIEPVLYVLNAVLFLCFEILLMGSGNGELGFYLISDGGRSPYRLHLRRPCFIYYQAYEEMVKGGMLSDAIMVMSSLNLIAGEMDG